tara:strand:+ start:560 stop:1009 length:450 start_codon:yes stop_codon:yes gene_type:complete
MNINFVLFLIIVITVYIFLSDLLVKYWYHYSKYIFAGILILIVVIAYIKPVFFQKILKEMILYNKKDHPSIRLYGSHEPEIYNSNNIFDISELKEKVILDSQSNKCFICDTLLTDSYQFDFIIPIQHGGKYNNNNVTIICPKCYFEKNK